MEAYVPGTPEYSLTFGSVEREQKLINLVKSDIVGRRRATKEIAEGMKALNSEIHFQTTALENSLKSGFSTLTDDLYELQAALHYDLSEIRWQLSEQNQFLRQIIDVLKRPRSAQAQELIQQGKRLLGNGYYQDSVERFGLALEFDKTDFEALLNLGFALIHVDDAPKAIDAFRRAGNLVSDDLPVAKAEAFLNAARAHFCLSDFAGASEACASAGNILGGIPDALRARVLYCNAMYKARSGGLPEALADLRVAIEIRTSFFGVAVSDEDWGDTLPVVRRAAEEWLQEAVSEARHSQTVLADHVAAAAVSNDVRGTIEALLEVSAERLVKPGYTAAVQVRNNCARGAELLREGQVTLLGEQALQKAEREVTLFHEKLERTKKELGVQRSRERDRQHLSALGGKTVSLGLAIFFWFVYVRGCVDARERATRDSQFSIMVLLGIPLLVVTLYVLACVMDSFAPKPPSSKGIDRKNNELAKHRKALNQASGTATTIRDRHAEAKARCERVEQQITWTPN